MEKLNKFSRLCTIEGLQSESGRPLNGQLAELMGWDPITSRLLVRMSPGDLKPHWKKMKANNVEVTSWSRIRHEGAEELLDTRPMFPWTGRSRSSLLALAPHNSHDTLWNDLLKVEKHLGDCAHDLSCTTGDPTWKVASCRWTAIVFHYYKSISEKTHAALCMKVDAMLLGLALLMKPFHCIPGGELHEILDKIAMIKESLHIILVANWLFPFMALTTDGTAQQLRPNTSPALIVEDAAWTVEEVDHRNEVAASRDPLLLQEQADHDWADKVELLLQRSDLHIEGSTSESEQIYIFPYTRAPREYMDALLFGPELGPIRRQMDAHNCAYVLPDSGAKIFVRPEHYQGVLQELEHSGIIQQLRPSHVIVAETLVPELEASIASIPSNRNVRVKKNGVLVLNSIGSATDDVIERFNSEQDAAPQSQDEDDLIHGMDQHVEEMRDWKHVLTVQGTFLCSGKVLRHPDSVTQSTTEAHGGTNPRRLSGAD
mmetsp:Transcript_101778/g.227380  ORF Transcript_101778/g.227380 Transcript_101778/m.227380 type:complete len:486 (-) Transcript_101778:276-1733(-)